MAEFPLPGMGRAVVAVPAPGDGPGYWAGASCAVPDTDGSFVVGYRVRNGHDGIDQTVIARSPDGERFTTVATLDQSRFGAQWMERPALVRTEQGRWRLFVCCGTPETKRWWIEVLEADDPAGFEAAEARPAFPGDERTGVKDPIVQLVDGRWHAWICCHPLDVPGAEDRMSSAYATSDDGWSWEWHGSVLTGRPGTWDARGARVTSVLPDGRAAYDGRATAEENWFERTGLARRTGQDGRFTQVEDSPVVDVRYWTCCRCPRAATGSGTRPGCPTRATHCAPSTSGPDAYPDLRHLRSQSVPLPVHDYLGIAAAWPPSGEWSGRAQWCASRD